MPMSAEPRNMTRKFPSEPNTKAATDCPWSFRALSTVLHGGQQAQSGTHMLHNTHNQKAWSEAVSDAFPCKEVDGITLS